MPPEPSINSIQETQAGGENSTKAGGKLDNFYIRPLTPAFPQK